MDQELFDGAACAASDLTARLLADLAQAANRLSAAESRFRAATASGLPIPLGVRAERTVCRQQVAFLRHVLEGMPTCGGDYHAASA
jgi:hypothetical protein